jgi:hypothetical protein
VGDELVRNTLLGWSGSARFLVDGKT